MSVKDVVCGMQVKSGEHEVIYLGIPYSFCSMQCHDRFLSNPHLYVGLPGQKAPKQQDVAVIKQRRLRLAEPLSAEHASRLAEALQEMMGIQSVTAEGEHVVVTYDMLLATEEQIEEKLGEIGVQLGTGLAERLRRAFVHYEEECEIGSLEVRENKHVHGH